MTAQLPLNTGSEEEHGNNTAHCKNCGNTGANPYYPVCLTHFFCEVLF